MKIKTQYIFPPIPTRAFDWCATTDDYDGPGSPIGTGATEEEAIADLKEQIEEDFERLSECCGAEPLDEIDDYGFAMCADCKEHAEFKTAMEVME